MKAGGSIASQLSECQIARRRLSRRVVQSAESLNCVHKYM